MIFLEELKGEATIKRLAEIKGIPKEEIEAAIQEVIEATWAGCDPVSRDTRRKIFRGTKPSPALFVGRLASHVKK